MENLLETIKRLEAELHHAGQLCPADRLKQLLHPDFYEVGRSGRLYDRKTVVDYLTKVDRVPDTVQMDHALTSLSSQSVLLTYRSAQRQSNALIGSTLRSSVWRLSDKGWQLFYHQGTPQAEGDKKREQPSV